MPTGRDPAGPLPVLGTLREQLERHEADLVRSWRRAGRLVEEAEPGEAATNTASADGGLGAGLSEGRAYDKRIAGFRDAVDRAVSDPDHPVCRGDADDRAPAPAGDQVTAHLLAREEHALQVDVDDRVPFRFGDLDGRAGERHAGVVDQHVEMSEGGEHVGRSRHERGAPGRQIAPSASSAPMSASPYPSSFRIS